MPLSMFIASKSSRHRSAAIALYRALIRASNKIALPPDLQPPGPVHPVAHLIRKRVGKNKTYTSLRLVYAAMAAGYRFLTLFAKAHDPSTSEYKMIVGHLRKRADEATLSRSKLPPQKPRRSWEKSPPLLTKISGPEDPPAYISTVRPRPKSDFDGERKVPVFGATAEGMPYLRITKPQPRLLSLSIAKKQRAHVEKGQRLIEIEETLMTAAGQEDHWDRLVRKELKKAGLKEEGPQDGPFGNYQRSEFLSKLWYKNKMSKTWKDWIARGKALHLIAEEERALAEKEARIPQGLEEGAEGVRTGQDELDSTTAKTLEKKRDISEIKAPTPVVDPFIAPAWRTVVRRDEARILSNRNRHGMGEHDEHDEDRGQARSDHRRKGGRERFPNKPKETIRKDHSRRTRSDDSQGANSNSDPFRALSVGRKAI